MQKPIRILMFGWEFPPFNSGGLGTACYGLTKGLSRKNVEIIFVLPRASGVKNENYMKILNTSQLDLNKKNIKFKTIDSIITPYVSSEAYLAERYKSSKIEIDEKMMYGEDLFSEVMRYSQEAKIIAANEDYDVIHCHDWLTFPAGIEAKKTAKKRGMNTPLITHVHATEFDRTAGHPNQTVYNVERLGMHEADAIITVSNYTRNLVMKHYAVDEKKIHVIHNSIDYAPNYSHEEFKLKKHHKIVLFVGRMTIQKGPDHFLWIAKKIAEQDDNIRFVMVGSGDMFPYIVAEAANLGIGDKVFFADFMPQKDVERAYRMADVYVMPSISEPFGLTALESMKNGTPVIVSKQSGVSEIIKNCIVVDFWDINKIAENILDVIYNLEKRNNLVSETMKEIKKFSWEEPARKCMNLYGRLLLEKSSLTA
ncbi:MAG: 4-alpha-glucanotransferase [Candidatus Altiarchaeales archaeon ex4484_96]|nr:MAG: 4-alpha-glucanotransferase [Candidatus Altiarchaeales archaeon ex4484_96]